MTTESKIKVLEPSLVDLTADIVTAYVSNNQIATSDLPNLIVSVHTALSTTAQAPLEPVVEELVPAVPVKKSISGDYIICLEDGKKFKSLKRHLRSHYGLSPEEYRTKWDLAPDYPMVAPNYAAARSVLAKKMGLGKKTSR